MMINITLITIIVSSAHDLVMTFPSRCRSLGKTQLEPPHLDFGNQSWDAYLEIELRTLVVRGHASRRYRKLPSASTEGFFL